MGCLVGVGACTAEGGVKAIAAANRISIDVCGLGLTRAGAEHAATADVSVRRCW